MEFRTIEQAAQLKTLDDYFEVRNPYLLSEFFKRENIYDDDLLADEGCYTFFQEIHQLLCFGKMSVLLFCGIKRPYFQPRTAC